MRKIDRYEILEEIGRGGMGVVYKAHDPDVDRDVAIKVISQKALTIPEIKARFKREARTAGKLLHENITIVHDFGEIDGKPYIVMEYLDGCELRALLDKKEPISLPQKLDYAIQICKGLGYAHDKNVIHRDIKPENIRILKNGRVKIIDFGIAKPVLSNLISKDKEPGTVLTEADMRIGTPWYMSPEQALRKTVDRRSDIFSFGILLYELLMYKKPFDGNEITVLTKILEEEPERINLEESGLTNELQVVLSKCLAKNVNDRYDNCADLITELSTVNDKAQKEKRVKHLVEEGYALEDEGRINEAIIRFDEILQIDPQHKEAKSKLKKLIEKEKESATIRILTGLISGDTISHYKVMQRLGGGGMGVVYKAKDTKLNRIVALKFLSPEMARDSDAQKRFFKEARAASALNHTNIGTIYEIDETEDGLIFISMAYYKGQTLREKIADGKLEISECLDLATQIARGLAVAHENKIIHRDIKPANIILTKEDEVPKVKIVDFGLAKLSGASTMITKTGVTLGTISYMSPEQIKGERLDHRCDIWSFGVVLYALLTNKLPFAGDNDVTVLYSTLHDDPVPVSELRSEIPPLLEQVIKKALRKQADERYASMRAVLGDLEQVELELRRATKVNEAQKAELARLIEIGKILSNKNKFTDALSRFQEALRIEPENKEAKVLIEECTQKQEELLQIDALLNQGKNYIENNQYEQALDKLKDVLDIDPNQQEAHEQIALVQEKIAQNELIENLLAGAEGKIEVEEFEPAIAAYQKILEIDSENQKASKGIKQAQGALAQQKKLASFIAEGKALFEKKNYSEALTQFEEALKLEPQDRETQHLIDLCKKKQQASQEIIRLLDEGKIHFKEEQYKQANEACNKILAIEPENAQALDLLDKAKKGIEQKELVQTLLSEAQANVEEQQFEEALETYNKVLEIEPTNQIAKTGLRQAEEAIARGKGIADLLSEGKSHLENRNYDEAASKFEEGLLLDPENQEIRNLLNQCKQKEEELKRVNQLLTEATAHLDEGQHRQAIQVLNEVLEIEAKHPEAQDLLEKAQMGMKQAELIQSLLTEAQGNVEKQQFEQAIEAYKRILEIEPENQNAGQGIQRAENSIASFKKTAGLIAEGESLLENENYDQALLRFKDGLELDPENQELRDLTNACEKKRAEVERLNQLLAEGKTYIDQGQYREATQALHAVLEIKPEYTEAKDLLEQAEKKLERADFILSLLATAGAKLEEQQFKQAIEIYGKILAIDPQNQSAQNGILQAEKAQAQRKEFAALVTAAKAELENKNYRDALTKFEAARELDPKNSELQDLIAQCEIRLKEVQKIEKLLNEGQKQAEKGKYQEALQTFREIVALDPNQQEANNFIKRIQKKIKTEELVNQKLSEAEAHLRDRKFEQAIETYQAILDKYPQNEKAIAAIQQAKHALAKKEDLLRLLVEGRSHLDRNNFPEALAKIKAAQKLDPNNQEVLDLTVKCEEKLKDLQEIVKLLSAGKKYLEKGRSPDALQTFRQILSIEPNHAEANDLIEKTKEKVKLAEQIDKLLYDAEFYLKKKRFDKAADSYREVLKIDPQNQKASVGLRRAEKGDRFLLPDVLTERAWTYAAVVLIVVTGTLFLIPQVPKWLNKPAKEAGPTPDPRNTMPPTLGPKIKDLKEVRELAVPKSIYAPDDFAKAEKYYQDVLNASDAGRYAMADSLVGSARNMYSRVTNAANTMMSQLSQAEQKAIDSLEKARRNNADGMPDFANGSQRLKKGQDQMNDGQFKDAVLSFDSSDKFFKDALRQKGKADAADAAEVTRLRRLAQDAQERANQARLDADATEARTYAKEAYQYAALKKGEAQQFLGNDRFDSAISVFVVATAGFQRAASETQAYKRAEGFFRSRADYQNALDELNNNVFTNDIPYPRENKRARDLYIEIVVEQTSFQKELDLASEAKKKDLRMALGRLDGLSEMQKSKAEVTGLRKRIIALDDEAPLINHTPQKSYDPKDPLIIEATVTDNLQVSKVFLWYKQKKGERKFNQREMILQDKDTYTYTLSKDYHKGKEIEYYFKAKDINGEEGAKYANTKKDRFKIKSKGKGTNVPRIP